MIGGALIRRATALAQRAFGAVRTAPASAALNATRFDGWLWNRFGRPDVVEVSPEAAVRRRSDTIYILGSGYSVNALSPEQLLCF